MQAEKKTGVEHDQRARRNIEWKGSDSGRETTTKQHNESIFDLNLGIDCMHFNLNPNLEYCDIKPGLSLEI
jgi:hypothetical protein